MTEADDTADAPEQELPLPPATSQLAVYLAAMPNILYDDPLARLIDFVDDPIVADSEAVEPFRRIQFHRLPRERLIRQAAYCSKDPRNRGSRQGHKVRLDGWLVENLK